MKRLIYLLVCTLCLLACERRDLTYSYNPTVTLAIVPDWSNLSELPDIASVYCYPESGESPIIKYSNDIDSITVNLPVGVYKILLFNEMPSDYYTIGFSGMDNYETAQINTQSTTSKWYASRNSDDDVVYEPAEFVASTYHSVEVSQSDIDEVLGLRSLDEAVDIPVHKTLQLTPALITKIAKVTIEVDQIHNLYSARAALYGMASGYTFSTQLSHSSYSTHTMESTTWSINTYPDPTQGNITTTFRSFGLPETETISRAFSLAEWGGMLYLEALLVDQDLDNIYSEQFELYDKTTIGDSDSDADIDTDIDVDVDVDVDIDVDIHIEVLINISLPDAEPAGGSSSGFDANVNDWEDEEKIEIPI